MLNQSSSYSDKFEVYLEGISVPFVSFSISESEGLAIPAAQILLPSNFHAVRILLGTIVQIFGKTINPYTEDEEMVLLFEGKVSSISYQSNPASSVTSISAIGLLANLITAKIRPADVIITRQTEEIETGFYSGTGEINTDTLQYKVSTYSKKECPSQEINYEFGEEIPDKNKKSIKDSLENLGTITLLGGLGDEFLRYFNKDNGLCISGNFMPLVNDFLKFFEISDIYFGIESKSFRVKESLFAFPNPNVVKPFQYKCINEALSKYQRDTISDFLGSDERMRLISIFEDLNRYLFYQLYFPASYPCIHIIPSKSDDKLENVPLRGFFMPYLESGPPALCNVFFPENVNSFEFVRNMEAEPTRLINIAEFAQISQGNLANLVNPIYVAPSIPLVYQSGSGLTSNFTLEESYRGINLKVTRFDTVLASLYKNEVSNDNSVNESGSTQNTSSVTSSGIDDIDIEKLSSETEEFMKNFALNEFFNMRYSSRQATLTTEWNPYRLLGLPALVFLPNKPSILGIISSIRTQVDSRGQAVCNYTLRNCRIIFDEETDSVFKLMDYNKTGLSQFVLNDYSENNLSLLNEYLYKKDLYGFVNIGECIYSCLVNGTLGYNKKLKTYIDVKDSYSDTEKFLDYSILNFIKGLDKNKNILINVNKLDNKKISLAALYNYYLYQSIKNLKSKYLELKNKADISYDGKPLLYKFISKLNWRKLMKKEDYLNYIGAKNDIKYLYIDSKNLYEILKNNSIKSYFSNTSKRGLKLDFSIYDLSNRKTFFSEIVNLTKKPNFVFDIGDYIESKSIQDIDFEKIHKIIKIVENDINQVNKLESLYRPYNIIRKAHVFYTFYKEKL